MDKNVTQLIGVAAPAAAKSGLVGHRCSNPSLIVGVELEIERLPHRREWYIEHLPAGIWTVETDGSLRPQGSSYEFITKPLEMQYAIAELTAFFGKYKFDESNYSDRCSVHVHTNITDFTQKQLANLALIYTVFEDVLFKFVNTRGCVNPEGYSRDTNIYCIPWNQCRMNFSLVNNIFADPYGAMRNWQKYTALNLLPIVEKGTVEWRHMHGTNDMEKLAVWFNVIGSIMKFARMADFDDVVKTIKSLNDTSAYRQFFDTVIGGYLSCGDDDQASMADGVINAKYALTNWDKLQGKKNHKKSLAGQLYALAMQYDEFDENDLLEDRAEPVVGAQEANLRLRERQAAIRAQAGAANNDGLIRAAEAVRRNEFVVEAQFPDPWVARNNNGRNR